LFAPKTEITTVKRDLKEGEDYVSRTLEADEIFLAKFLNQVKELVTRIKDRWG
jgi:basic amino acid/polyamine antiporter, APA family